MALDPVASLDQDAIKGHTHQQYRACVKLRWRIFALMKPWSRLFPLLNISSARLIPGCLGLLLTMHVNAQKRPDFHPPMDPPLYLSGSFGELRTNHFHSGIDIRTGGVEGKPVYSIADGWVSRIRISPGGFGKAVYIDHPDGYTSVYAHMLDFRDDIARYARSEQYRLERFDVDLYLDKGLILVKKGDKIGRSGNSGSSGGPHLHFEVRDAATQHPLEPQQLGIRVKDMIKPSIKGIRIYPEGDGSLVNGSSAVLSLPVAGWGSQHRIETKDTLRIRGKVSFGFRVYDVANDAPHKNGIYRMQVLRDTVPFFGFEMKRFSFDETRYINSMIDYAEYQHNSSRYIRTRIAPNNRLSVYTDRHGRGILEARPGTYIITVIVSDYHANESRLVFPLIVESVVDSELLRLHRKPSAGKFMSWKQDNQFSDEGVTLFIPGDALYDSLHFKYSRRPALPGTFSPLHILHDKGVPLHTSCTLRIRPENLPVPLQSKALIVRCNEQGKCSDADGEWKDGWVETRIREFGNYSIGIDTVPPRLHALNVTQGKVITQQSSLRFRTADNLSGVRSYRMEVNGKWVLLEYDPKNELLVYFVDPAHFRKGKNEVVVTVTDDKDNVSSLKLVVQY